MRLILLAALLALSSCAAAPKYKVTCVPVAQQIVGCIAEPIEEK